MADKLGELSHLGNYSPCQVSIICNVARYYRVDLCSHVNNALTWHFADIRAGTLELHDKTMLTHSQQKNGFAFILYIHVAAELRDVISRML